MNLIDRVYCLVLGHTFEWVYKKGEYGIRCPHCTRSWPAMIGVNRRYVKPSKRAW